MGLFIARAIPVFMGIVWTSVLLSNDAHVVAPLVTGFFFLVLFALWETYGSAKHPLTPTSVFTSPYGRDFRAPCIALAVTNMFYYSGAILWPTMINVFYTNGGSDWKYGVLLSTIQDFAITPGMVMLGVFSRKIKHWQWQLTGTVLIMVVFGALLALGTPNNKGLMIGSSFSLRPRLDGLSIFPSQSVRWESSIRISGLAEAFLELQDLLVVRVSNEILSPFHTIHRQTSSRSSSLYHNPRQHRLKMDHQTRTRRGHPSRSPIFKCHRASRCRRDSCPCHDRQPSYCCSCRRSYPKSLRA